jgi:hypothetical protein
MKFGSARKNIISSWRHSEHRRGAESSGVFDRRRSDKKPKKGQRRSEDCRRIHCYGWDKIKAALTTYKSIHKDRCLVPPCI